MLDTLIRGAEVHDGEGGPPRRLAVGIRGRRIVLAGDEPTGAAARATVDGAGLLLSPGFIDPHASTGLGYFFDRAADHKLFQGVTTELVGNCGDSPAPIGPHGVEEMEAGSAKIGFPFDWRTLAEYFDRLETRRVPIHLGTLVGHSTLRAGAAPGGRSIGPKERAAMARSLEQALGDGAFGLSTGLIYPPGCYAGTAELIELARVAARFDGLYASHLRNEREGLEDAVEEALEIGRLSGARVLISHLKAAERANWGKLPAVIERIERFRRRHDGRAAFDVYPYTATSTRLRVYLPPELFAEGSEIACRRLGESRWRTMAIERLRQRDTDFARMTVLSGPAPPEKGQSVEWIADHRGVEPAEVVCDLVAADPETWIVYHCMAEDDLDAAVAWPGAMICSDSWSYPVNAPRQIGEPHPRTFGAFSRFLDRYVFSRPRMSYGEAVRRITSLPADYLGLTGRGRIRVGNFADLVLLDPERFEDRADYENPRRLSRGVAHLWLEGRPVIRAGERIDEKSGRILRHAA